MRAGDPGPRDVEDVEAGAEAEGWDYIECEEAELMIAVAWFGKTGECREGAYGRAISHETGCHFCYKKKASDTLS